MKRLRFTATCPNCKHQLRFHVLWGGGQHYHGTDHKDCSNNHQYCGIPLCSCEINRQAPEAAINSLASLN